MIWFLSNQNFDRKPLTKSTPLAIPSLELLVAVSMPSHSLFTHDTRCSKWIGLVKESFLHKGRHHESIVAPLSPVHFLFRKASRAVAASSSRAMHICKHHRNYFLTNNFISRISTATTISVDYPSIPPSVSPVETSQCPIHGGLDRE